MIKNMAILKKQKGFTLIELLVVIAIIAIIAGAVFVALNPVQRFRDARNSKRFNSIETILTAIHQCIVDKGGNPDTCLGVEDTDWVDDTKYEIVSGEGINTNCDDTCTEVAADNNCLDLLTDTTPDLISYLKDLPVDPETTVSGHTAFQIEIDDKNLITITACGAEDPETYGTGTDTIRTSR